MAYISVIIPCYNAESYIDRCMDCLLRQTVGFENLEILFVNDGSEDGTIGKLMWWEHKYSAQIVLINCENNGGPGMARNIGLKYATAEYIGYLDVDDVIADSFYEKLYHKIIEGYDWVSAKFVHIQSGQQPDFCTPHRKVDKEYHCKPQEYLLFKELTKNMHNGKFGHLSSRIFLKKFIVKNELYFPEGLMYEDNYWAVKCDIFSRNIYIIDEILYCYYRNANSIISSCKTLHHLDRMKIEEMIVDLLIEKGLFKKYYKQIEGRFIKKYFCDTWFAVFLKMNTIPDILPAMRQKILELFPNYMENAYLKKLNPLDQAVLKLLESEETCTTDELVYIKETYVRLFYQYKNNLLEKE